MKEILLFAGALTSAVAGAGLITGCEISVWFLTGSYTDRLFIALSAMLLGVFFYLLLRFCSTNGIENNYELFALYDGAASFLARTGVYLLMLFVFSAMTASGAELLCPLLHLNKAAVCIIFGAAMTALSCRDPHRLVVINGMIGIFILA